jgi:hypothetical protein
MDRVHNNDTNDIVNITEILGLYLGGKKPAKEVEGHRRFVEGIGGITANA